MKHKINREIMQLVFFQREDQYLPICGPSWSILNLVKKSFADDEDIRVLNMSFGIFIYHKNRGGEIRYDYLAPTSTSGNRNPGYREKSMAKRLEKIISELNT